jgi:hypothetical protein
MHHHGVFRRFLGGCEKADGEQAMTNEELIERLGQAQQKVMSLTVAKRALEARLKRVEEEAEVLEELVMDVVADCRDGACGYEIEARIGRVMQKLEGYVE